MYVDKPMRGHNPMQAIARVNRVFEDKPGRPVVDYIGIANVEELIAMAKKFQEAAQRGECLGLSPDEMAVYDALAMNESAVRELGDATLKKFAVELTQSLRKSVTVDWSKRETVRAKLRVMVNSCFDGGNTRRIVRRRRPRRC